MYIFVSIGNIEDALQHVNQALSNYAIASTDKQRIMTYHLVLNTRAACKYRYTLHIYVQQLY